MAALWFSSGTTMIFDAQHTLDRFKAVMAARMRSVGFEGTVIDDFQVAGERHGGWTALHPIWRRDLDGGRQEFVFVAMCAADDEDTAARNASDVNAMIGWSDPLWP